MEAMSVQDEVLTKAKQAREAARILASLPARVKDKALLAMADALEERQQFLLQANAGDVRRAQDKGLGEAFVDRLLLSEKRVAEMAAGLREVAALPDPVGEVVAGWRRPNGLEIRKIRVPLGVIGIIYESRPNVTVEAAGLCLKAGNAVLLRGGSEAIESNTALVRVIGEAATRAGMPEGAIRLIETTDRVQCRRAHKERARAAIVHWTHPVKLGG
jgi:glutamate-5-semialdehyde dehydrogenase